MPYEEDGFEAEDGLVLHEHRWLPERDAKGVLVMLHGFLEHAGRYAEAAAELNRHGYAVYAMDLRGHGKSEGERVFIESFSQYLGDIEVLLRRVRAREPEKPVFLFGHSMGGTIFAMLAATRPPDARGVVLSAPAVLVGGGVFPVLRHLAGLVSRVFPRLRVVRMGLRYVSRDPEVVAEIQRDPLVFHGRFPVRTGAEVLSAARLVQDVIPAMALPLLILHGTGDRVTDPEGSRRLHARASSSDKTLNLYEGLYHDLLHEPEKERVMADLVEWLDARR
jgi:alpha-beta hydrolase superfamily lysophospholipase